MSERRDVELNLLQTFFQIVLHEQTKLAKPRVIHEDIDSNIGARCLVVYIRRRLGAARSLAKISERVTCAFSNSEASCLDLSALRATRDKVVTFAREDTGQRMPDPERGAGDECGLVVWHTEV